MGYMHIDNLYKNQDIMHFKQCYATEKVHGTSANISYIYNQMTFFSGGMKIGLFESITDLQGIEAKLKEQFTNINIIIYGEAYGGKEQGMSATYGMNPMFIVFDVSINGNWLNVENAEAVAINLGLEFVPYNIIDTDINSLSTERDKPSVVAKRRGITKDKQREGIVCRPLIELKKNNNERIIVKYKTDKFNETKTDRPIRSDYDLQIISDANDIVEEWVTDMRLTHVLDKLNNPTNLSAIPIIIKAMVEDVYREGQGEIVQNREVERQIINKTILMFKDRVKQVKRDD